MSETMLRDLQTPLPPKPVLTDISVVIPTLGRPILESCLRWLADGSHWPGRVIVVDQGRNPVVAEWLAALQAAGLDTLYVPSEQNGRSAGINRGLEQVQTRYVAITDDDCFVAPDWLENMVIRLRREPEIILTGRVDMAGNDEAEFSTVTSRQPKLYTKPQLKAHPFIGGNAGMALALVERIGLFDEHPCLASAEDSDYGYRALRLGIPIAYDPDVPLYHYHWRDASQRAARYADYARSQGGFYGTHLRRGDRLILMQTVRALVRSPLRWLRGLLSGDNELAENGRAHTLNLLPGIIAGLKRGRQ
ncbi:MAG: glycosyltransferase [Chloroflexota bacterium]